MTLSTDIANIAILAVREYRAKLSPAQYLAALAQLKLEATVGARPSIRFVPHETDDCLWSFAEGGPWLHYTSTRRSFIPWAFWQAMLYGEMPAQYVATPGAVRKGKGKFIDWLNRVGARALAREVALVRIARDGTMRYSPDETSPVIVFEDAIYAPSTHGMP